MIAIWAKLMIGAIFVTPIPHGGIVDPVPYPTKTQCVTVQRHLIHSKYVPVCVRRAPVKCDRYGCVG